MSDIVFDKEKINKVGEAFTPSYPIEIKSLFSGRREQLTKAFSIIPQKGLHAIIYGDRGVGKTSFSNILKVIFEDPEQQVHKISCNSEDTFSSLWRNIFSGFSIKFEEIKEKVSFRKDPETIENIITLSDALQPGVDVTTAKVIDLLKMLINPIIIIDEFDRLEDAVFNKKLLTDTIKAISDTLPDVTVIIVGVSEDISNLIMEHASIERNLSQIYMPTMSADEITEIIQKGAELLQITFEDAVVNKIVQLASGYPHFAHSLCYHCAMTAIITNNTTVSESHLQLAVKQTIDNTHESLRNSYRIATAATKRNIYADVLFAASVTSTDEYGYFQANDLESILSESLGKEVRVANFVGHLAKFCTPQKGEILRVSGAKYTQRYKFRNPLMRAFIRLKVENERNNPQPEAAHLEF